MDIEIIDLLLRPMGALKHFHHRGKKYCVRSSGRRTLSLLSDVASSPMCQSTTGLLMLRPRIRRAVAFPAPVLLTRVIDTTRNTRVLRIAIWMLGRIGRPYATKSVAWHANHPFFPVRREAIRTLHRLHAWTELRRISREHEDPRTRRIAKPASPRSYADRLGEFVSSRQSLESGLHEHPLVIDPLVEIDTGAEVGRGRPPKSGSVIAAVLKQIQRLVRRTRRQQNLRGWSWPLRFRAH